MGPGAAVGTGGGQGLLLGRALWIAGLVVALANCRPGKWGRPPSARFGRRQQSSVGCFGARWERYDWPPRWQEVCPTGTARPSWGCQHRALVPAHPEWHAFTASYSPRPRAPAAEQGVYVLMSGLDYERLVLSAGPLGIMQVTHATSILQRPSALLVKDGFVGSGQSALRCTLCRPASWGAGSADDAWPGCMPCRPAWTPCCRTCMNASSLASRLGSSRWVGLHLMQAPASPGLRATDEQNLACTH